MTNHLQGFDFMELTNMDSNIRKKAQEMARLAMQKPLEYLQFLTSEITGTNDEKKAYFGLTVIKMVVTEVKFPTHTLLKVLDFYSNLFVNSKKASFISPFTLLLQTLLLQVDSQSEKTLKQSQKTFPTLLSSHCYLNKEAMLLQSSLGEVDVRFLLAFLSIYIEHLNEKNINLATIRSHSFKHVYQRVNSIKFEGNAQSIHEFTKIKATFLILVLLNTQKVSSNAIIQYFSIIPKQVIQYGIVIVKARLLGTQSMHILFTFLMKNVVSIKTDDALKFLREQLETHLMFAKLLKLIIKDYNRAQLSSVTMIDDQGQSTNSISSIQEQQIPVSSQQFSEKIKIQDCQDALYLWIFKILLIHDSIKQNDILEFAEPLDALFQNIYFEHEQANSFIQWMVNKYNEGTKGDDSYEKFCYYAYYMHGCFFNFNNLTEIKQQVGLMALSDLKSLRFSKTKDMCSVIYYLRMFIGTTLPPSNFHSEVISTLMSLFYSLNCNEFSEAILTLFTPDLKKTKDSMCKANISIWPIIATVKPHLKQQVLRCIRDHLQSEQNIDNYFISDLVNTIIENPISFETYYLKETVIVRIEYLRLISLGIHRIIDLNQNIKDIIKLLEVLIRTSPKDPIQIYEILDIFASILYYENKKTKVNAIMPKIQVINLLIDNFRFLANDIKQHLTLLIQIASLPYIQSQFEQTQALNKLQRLTMEYLLSFQINDEICDILEIFFTLNEAAITETVTNCIMKKTFNTPNHYRMAYILSPRPYPAGLSNSIELSELKHYKWAALFMMGKYNPPSFHAISRAPRDQTSLLIQQFEVMGAEVSKEEVQTLKMLRDKLTVFSKDDEEIWLSGIEKAAVYKAFRGLYQTKYRKCSLDHSMRKFFKQFGCDLE